MFQAPGSDSRGELLAWDPIKQQKAWAVPEKFPVWSGTVVTAGDVVFYGTMDRYFKAVDAKTGKVLWQFTAPSGIIGQPITYAVNGTQYVAVLSGIGGWPGVVANAAVDPRVRNAALGFAGATQDLPTVTTAGSTLLVFAVPPDQRTASQPGVPGAAPSTTGSANPEPPQNGSAPREQNNPEK
jgi:alcohol dehydrogenase (cytochrome c)